MLNLDVLGISGRDILQALAIPTHIIDDQFMIWRNEASKKIFDSRSGGNYCYEVICGRRTICDDCLIIEVFNTGTPQYKQRQFKDRIFDVEIIPLFNKTGKTVIGVVETLKDITALVKSATTDFLTNIYNRRGILNALTEEFARTERYHSNFSIILFDLDNFKRINDNYGHAVGDKVLIEISSLVKEILRTADKIGRYGGDEFLVILSETGFEEAAVLSNRIRTEIDNLRIQINKKLKIQTTISIGLTQYLSEDKNIDVMTKRADELLYAEKRKKIRSIT